ncbi:uncharacterized protein N0V89_002484 [Didymosphaeria variabile]|uniref:Uncharacterized protein n=1 Tax=Didymosphaeria variabile TaxID=1932322 RepID=A0A9W9CEE4_9PLEO|nr:uncharacterized protein N0V89_002484 [Didymosphaeria variabile]KAJ4357907.1 hypothetical protein N0V89_002484 [Didymosphaeria variabile]
MFSWLYTGKIPKDNDGWLHVAEVKGMSEDHGSQDEAVELAQLKAIVFGDRFLAFSFQAAVQKRLVKALVNINNPAWYASVLYTYANMTKDNPTLDLLAGLQFRFWDEETDDAHPKELTLRPGLPNDLLVRVMKKFAAHRGKSRSRSQDLDHSDYHVRSRD